MLTETKRRILAAACGVEWHEVTLSPIYIGGEDRSTCLCGKTGRDARTICPNSNLTFTTPADWELVRVAVVENALYLFAFGKFINKQFMEWEGILYHRTPLEWWLTLSPEECCKIAHDFILANLNLFPADVQEKIREIIGG